MLKNTGMKMTKPTYSMNLEIQNMEYLTNNLQLVSSSLQPVTCNPQQFLI
jgi:hypothetical protein